MISRWIRARLSHAPWLARALGIHSPSRHMLGTCWCRERPALEQFRLELLLMMVRLDGALTQLELEPPPPTTTFLAEGSTVIERPTNPPTSSAADRPTTTEAPPDPGCSFRQ